jgi:hypothetical protein
MATLNATLDTIERKLGFPRSRSNSVAQSLRWARIIPSGAPGVAPELSQGDALSIVIALAIDTTLHKAADAVLAYRDLRPGGVDLAAAEAPVGLCRTAGDYIELLAEQAEEGSPEEQRDVAAVRLEIVSSWPEITIHRPGAEPLRFVEPGALASHWQSKGHRRSTTINGAALVDTIRELFPEKN